MNYGYGQYSNTTHAPEGSPHLADRRMQARRTKLRKLAGIIQNRTPAGADLFNARRLVDF